MTAALEPQPAPRFSVIIPALNEASCIAATVAACRALRPEPEIIVADGASEDGTAHWAAEAGARVVRCARRGRSLQMNAGAALARGEWLVFLHADTRIPPAAWAALVAAVGNEAMDFGGFRRRWEPPSRVLDMGSWLAVWRGRIAKVFLGDQAIFVRRALFERAGGYEPILLFEDVELCRRLRRMGRGRLIEPAVVTSRRRFEAEGDLRRWARNIALWWRYSLGANPDRLARIYYPGYYDAATAGEFSASPAAAGESTTRTPKDSRAASTESGRPGRRGA
jgi:rSAM/selenodomain-associated transferase 2